MKKATHVTRLVAAAALSLGMLAGVQSANAAGEPAPLPHTWSFQGLFGTFDRAQLQRGFQVFKEVCNNCHSLHFIHFRNLEGIGFSKEEVKAIAAGYQVTDGPNDEGDMFQRPGKPYDVWPSPFPNEKAAAAANGGAAPPDLSLITKALPGGPEYVRSILLGFGEAPADHKVLPGTYYNKFFPGGNIKMPPPLSDGAVEYSDGTKATIEQEANDVVAFLSWAADPKMEQRKQTGLSVVLFLIVLTALLYALKRAIWRDVH